MNKVLFILKRKEDYNQELHSHIGLSTGLYNSASFMNEMLNSAGIESNLEVVIDNNDIDREVNKYKPTHVIIEALWVVPEKFQVLCKLHPDVKWIIRLHSELPFLANEGIAMDWVAEYVKYDNLLIGINAPRMMNEVEIYLTALYGKGIVNKLLYMPNYYPNQFVKHARKNDEYIDIGCFGAIRPLKNHMVQAIAAVKFAEYKGKKLRFHINGDRLEMKGDPILHNLKATFKHLSGVGHELVCHDWTPRDQFLELCAQMDIGMQVSFSETFNIVGCDFISQGVPVVGSSEIPWSFSYFNANPTETDEIVKALCRAHKLRWLNLFVHKLLLKWYTHKTKTIWTKIFK